MPCLICKREKELGGHVCFDCADAESIIEDGTDMYDKGMDSDPVIGSVSLKKLQYLHEKGWKFTGKKQSS